ncbi:flagellar hook capping FlgD N-terminal domain-containing protein [Buchnera aphidicola]|uniref:Basal-body rod modification protein FlgD n=1 Tax=Buchnera aphidicola (Lipaphis pseudobrassicae) TaxID=1258543 RepID=A0A4D6Y7M6_9GAMM|nr:flagellar hook capping FlgD N-terminal domain-containing protein [Buchnera aphidicola]QCI22201.1 flagellar biosynthesis protein FlgD [Buchnera aphidicola (Lipaphis pseudobrassicae)]
MGTINVDSHIDNNFIEKNNNSLQNDFNPLDLQKNFLSLLIAQIKNQDPTDPIKNTELTTQLAQINTASGIERLNNTVGNFSNQINQNKNIQVSSLIGRRVMIPRNQIVHTKNTKTRLGVELIGNATSITIKIIDNNKKVLHIFEKKQDNIKPGVYNFIWDGKDLDQNNVETGKYNILVTAKNKDQNVPIQGLSEALVHSIITSSGNDPIIDLGAAGNTTLSKIREILK